MASKSVVLMSGAALAAMVLAACGSSGSKSADQGSQQPYRVVISAGLSAQGVLADNSNTSMLSVKASADVLNKQGGIDGRKIEVQVIDDGGDPTVAVTKLRDVINSGDKPDLYLNSGPSTIAAATLPILDQNKILSFNVGATADSADPSKFPLNFDLSPSAADYIAGIGAYMVKQGYKKVGVIHGNTAYGQDFGKRAASQLEKDGITVTGNKEYDVKSLDMTPQLSALKSGSPDALVMDGYGAPVGYLLKGIEKLGWNIPIVGNTSVSATGLTSTSPPAGIVGTPEAKNVSMQVYPSTEYDANAKDVNEAVNAMAALGQIKSTLILAYNYDALRLVKAAADKVGSDDTAKLASAIATDAVTTAARTVIISKYNFTDKSHAPNVSPDVFRFVTPSLLKNGQFQPQT